MKISEFYQFSRISKYGGVYILWEKGNRPLYVYFASKFASRFSRHYEYLKPLAASFSICPTNQHRLLEYTLIQRVNPIYNRHRSWNYITRWPHGKIPYLLNENSYSGYKFDKKSDYPYEMGGLEDTRYLEGVLKLERELKENSNGIRKSRSV
jgi:hypothetical protein